VLFFEREASLKSPYKVDGVFKGKSHEKHLFLRILSISGEYVDQVYLYQLSQRGKMTGCLKASN